MIFEIYGPAAASSDFFHRELLRAHKRMGDALSRLAVLQGSVGMLEMALDNFLD